MVGRWTSQGAEKKVVHFPVPDFRIGVVGVRELDNDERANVVRQFENLLSVFADVLAEPQIEEDGSNDGSSGFLINSMAEGVDQIAIDVALELGFGVIAPVPFESTVYVDLFSVRPERHRRRFWELSQKREVQLVELNMPHQTTRERKEGYSYAARVLMENSDVLVAVARKEQERKSGGTRDTIVRALRRGIPIISLDPKDDSGVDVQAESDDTCRRMELSVDNPELEEHIKRIIAVSRRLSRRET